MREMVVTDGVLRHAKLQSDHHHQETNTQLFYSFVTEVATKSVKAPKGESVAFHGLAHSKLTWESSNRVFDH